MAEATKAAGAAVLGQARIAGRIVASRRSQGASGTTFRTLLRLPAADAYSSPATVEVRSTERLGGADEEVALVVAIGGYARSFPGKGERGEPGEVVRTAENVLSFVNFG